MTQTGRKRRKERPTERPEKKAKAEESLAADSSASRQNERKLAVGRQVQGTSEAGSCQSAVEYDRAARWTEDGCFFTATAPRQLPDGTFARPSGRRPKGLEWDAIRGLYAPRETLQAGKKSTNQPVKRKRENKASGENAGELAPKTQLRKPNASGPKSKAGTKIGSKSIPTQRAADLKSRRREDGCLVPASEPPRSPNGTYARPFGRAPNGTVWDGVQGLWVPKSAEAHEGHIPPGSRQAAPVEAVLESAPPLETPKREGPLPVGTIVDVAKRSWPGVNKEGGRGKVMDYSKDETTGEFLYRISYALGGREKAVSEKFLTVHELDSQRGAGSKGRRSTTSNSQHSSASSVSY